MRARWFPIFVAAVCSAAAAAVGAQQPATPPAGQQNAPSLASTYSKPLVVLGCVTRGDGGQLVITDTRVLKADLDRNIGRYRISGDTKQLDPYFVNNQVELTGRFEGDAVGTGMRTFRMDSVQRVAFSCWKNPDGTNPPNLR
jgi:hypothetical protein